MSQSGHDSPSDVLQVKCACGKLLRVSRAHLGKRLKCPDCGHAVAVRESSGRAADATGRPQVVISRKPRLAVVGVWAVAGVGLLAIALYLIRSANDRHERLVAHANARVTAAIEDADNWQQSGKMDGFTEVVASLNAVSSEPHATNGELAKTALSRALSRFNALKAESERIRETGKETTTDQLTEDDLPQKSAGSTSSTVTQETTRPISAAKTTPAPLADRGTLETRDKAGNWILLTETASLGVDVSDGRTTLAQWKRDIPRVKVTNGVLIDQLARGDDNGGFKVGDVLYQLDRQPIETPADIGRVLKNVKPGATVAAYVLRDRAGGSVVDELGLAVNAISEYDARLNRLVLVPRNVTETSYTLRSQQGTNDANLTLIPQTIITQAGVCYFWVKIQASDTGSSPPRSFDVMIGDEGPYHFWEGSIVRRYDANRNCTIDECHFAVNYQQMSIAIEIATSDLPIRLSATGTRNTWEHLLTPVQKRDFLHSLEAYEIFYRRLLKLPL